MWDPLRPKYLKKYKNPNIWRKKTKHKKKTFVKGSAQNFKVYLKKTPWTLDSEGIYVTFGRSLRRYEAKQETAPVKALVPWATGESFTKSPTTLTKPYNTLPPFWTAGSLVFVWGHTGLVRSS